MGGNMQKRILDKRESIIIIIFLTIISILCFVKFIIDYIDISESLKLLQQSYDSLQLSNINIIKFISIFALVLCMILFLSTFVPLFIKNINVKRVLLLSTIIFCATCIVFYFILLFYLGDGSNLDSEEFLTYMIESQFVDNFSYLISPIILIVLLCFSSFYLSNLLFDKEKVVDQISTESATDKPIQEKTLEVEIEKLKSQLRIKDLEKEYMRLKGKLDE